MLKLKLQYFGHLMQRGDSLEKTWCWLRLKAGEKETTEGEAVGCHHQLNGHAFEKILGASDGQGGLACCSPWGCKESVTTERLNWIELGPVFPSFTEEIIFPSFLCLGSFVKKYWSCISAVLLDYFVPLTYLCVCFMPRVYGFKNCKFGL